MTRYTLERDGDRAGYRAGIKSIAIWWNDDGTYKEIAGERPTVGCSMWVGDSMVHHWLTTEIVEILESSEDIVRFRTKNSVYTWNKTE